MSGDLDIVYYVFIVVWLFFLVFFKFCGDGQFLQTFDQVKFTFLDGRDYVLSTFGIILFFVSNLVLSVKQTLIKRGLRKKLRQRFFLFGRDCDLFVRLLESRFLSRVLSQVQGICWRIYIRLFFRGFRVGLRGLTFCFLFVYRW